MNIRRFLAFIFIVTLILVLYGCSNKTAELAKPTTTVTPTETDPTPTVALPSEDNPIEENIILNKEWNYDESVYVVTSEDAKESWEEFQNQRDNGAPTDEILSTLSQVIIDDELFVPGYIEYARYYLLQYNETGDPTCPSNAMNVLTQGYANTSDPLLNQLKESLGWGELSKIIEQANEALKERNSAAAFEIINTLPDQYFNILEASQIISILNDFDDTYYYLIMGDTLGKQYIVHFQIDGTYERVKMNEDGIYDSGTWESSFLEDWDIRFADLQFQGATGSYFWVEYDSEYNAYEYKLNISIDGKAKEQFEYIAALGKESSVGSEMVSILTNSKWQVDEGWYYQFNNDGTGIVSMTDNSYSYGISYFEHPEKENAVIILSSDMPEEYTWLYDPASGTFTQESYGFDMSTDTAYVFYMDVFVYNG